MNLRPSIPVLVVVLVAPTVVVAGPGCQPRAPTERSDAGVPFVRLTEGAAATDRASTGSGQWMDVDGDEDLDLFVSNGYDVSSPPAPQADRLYINDGTGRLISVESGPLVSDTAYSSGATWGDYDNDGHPDVFVPAQRGQDNLLYRNEGDATFVAVTQGPPVEDGGTSYAASWVDVDGDGNLDLYVSNGGLSGTATAFLYRNLGDGRFERAPPAPFTTDSAAYLGGSWADYDDDGDPDLFVARGWSPHTITSALYRNDGDWRFTTIEDSPAANDTVRAKAVAWGDYDNDGDLDLAVGTRGPTRVYRNEGGRLVPVRTGGPHVVDGGDTSGVSWVDYDNDGDLDLLVANWGTASFLYTNLGDGRFERRNHGDLGRLLGFGGGISWGDMDGDGDLDLYRANWPNWPGGREENHLYRNDLPPGAHWLGVRLVGTRSNRSAIGARLRVRARIGGRDVWQSREVVGHSGFRSQDPLRQHFGLGDATRVQEVEVRWPSGLRERFTDLPVDRVVVLTEGEGRP